MRWLSAILFLAVIGLLTALLVVRGDRARVVVQLGHQTDLVRLRDAELSEAQRKVAECSSRLQLSSVSVEELRRRGNVVATVDAWMELVCIPAPDRSFDPNSPITLSTSLKLSTPAGFYTLVTRRLEPVNFVADEQQKYRIVLAYEPLNMNEVIGKPIEDLASITVLTTHYNDVLHAVGLRLAPDGIRTFVLNVNGLEAVRVQGFHAETDPPGDVSWNVSPDFARLVSTYSAALQAKINARAASAPPQAPR
jgi:hypothetical protein